MDVRQNILELLSLGRASQKVSLITAGAFFSRLPEEIIIGGGFTSSELNKNPLNRNPKALADLAVYIKDTLAAATLSVPFLLTVESEAYGGEVEPPQTGGLDTKGYDYPLKSVDDTLNIIDPLRDGRLPMVTETVALLKSRASTTPIVADVGAPLAILSSLLDTREILKAFVSNKEAVHKVLTRISDNTISYAKALINNGASIIVVMDNFSTPEIVGGFFREFTVPYINRITDAVRAAGAETVLHICGDLVRFGEDLSMLSSEVLSVDTTASIKELRGLLPNHILAGGVTYGALCSDNSAEIIAEVRRAMANGLQIIAPPCGLDALVKVARLRDMVSALL